MIAVLFAYVWPEPFSSAAGVRTLELCKNLRALGFEPLVLSPCKENTASAYLNQEGIRTLPTPANDSSVVEQLKKITPNLVLYDRFVMEEQFGWRARELWPEALHLVDTQDLHSVRRARERLLAAGASAEEISSLTKADFGLDLDRELSSLYRADGCLVVSTWERDWLLQQNYPAERVFYLPFGAAKENSSPSFADRKDYAFLGNFRHPPNLDAVDWLAKDLWPKIHNNNNLYLYGAYPPATVSKLHGKDGIIVAGSVQNHRAALQKHRVLLAPLRFGAGIKGKVLEAWATGTPVVGTPIAMEGFDHASFQGEEFIQTAKALYESESQWQSAQQQGYKALETFAPERLKQELAKILEIGFSQKQNWRQHWISRVLKHQTNNSTKYFSLWIEAKNQKAPLVNTP